MDPAHHLFVQQEVRKALNQMQSEQQRIQRLDDPMAIARIAQSSYGQAWARQGNPDYRRAHDDLRRAAEHAIQDLFDKTPTIDMAHDCWQASRGWSVRAANMFYQEWESLKNKSGNTLKPE